MKYSNVVRFIPKQGEYDNVIKILSEDNHFDGLIQNIIIKTSETTCCAVGIWESEAHLVKARPNMIALLDTLRDKLDIISDDLGVTDPVSGPIVYET